MVKNELFTTILLCTIIFYIKEQFLKTEKKLSHYERLKHFAASNSMNRLHKFKVQRKCKVVGFFHGNQTRTAKSNQTDISIESKIEVC